MGKFLSLCLLALVCTGCTFVKPGEVGIKVNYYGTEKGVEDLPIVTGRVFYNPLTETVYTYPTFMQNRRWLIEDGEGFTFNSKEGAKVTGSIGLNYTLDRAKVPVLFVTHRAELDDVTDNYVRTQVQDALNSNGPKYNNIELMGVKQSELLAAIRDELNKTLGDRGFIFDNVSFIGALQPDERVAASINSVIEATQRAQEAQAKVVQVQAEAQQAREKANGEADAILTKANAEATANLTVAKSITPELIRYEITKKWDGVAPKVLGGDSGMLLNVGTDDAAKK